jgi:hypothetical protein
VLPDWDAESGDDSLRIVHECRDVVEADRGVTYRLDIRAGSASFGENP